MNNDVESALKQGDELIARIDGNNFSVSSGTKKQLKREISVGQFFYRQKHKNKRSPITQLMGLAAFLTCSAIVIFTAPPLLATLTFLIALIFIIYMGAIQILAKKYITKLAEIRAIVQKDSA